MRKNVLLNVGFVSYFYVFDINIHVFTCARYLLKKTRDKDSARIALPSFLAFDSAPINTGLHYCEDNFLSLHFLCIFSCSMLILIMHLFQV